jgi:hypothetical protein
MIELTPQLLERMLLIANRHGEFRLPAAQSAKFCERLSRVPFTDDLDLQKLESEIMRLLTDAGVELGVGSRVH